VCAVQLIPLVAAIVWEEKQSFQSLFSGLLFSLLIGGSLFLGFRSTEKVRTPRLTLLLPVCGAISLAFVTGLPFFFLHPDLGLIVAFYEGMSLITTTGASAYEGAFEHMKAIALWKALVAWIGGFAGVCITLSFLTSMNIGGLQLHQSPMPFGDSVSGYPRLRATASTLFPVYLLVTVVSILMIWLSGPNVYESILLALSTLSSTGLHYGNIEGFGSIVTQFILIILMFATVMNWDLHYARYTKKKIRVGRDVEAATLLITTIVITSGAVLLAGNVSFSAIWEAFFTSVSAISTTGLVPNDFFDGGNVSTSLGILFALGAAIGGCAIGTGGGLKQLRSLVIFKAGKAEVDRLAHPHGVSAISVNRVEVQKPDIEAIWLLLGSFVLLMAIGALLFAVLGIHIHDAITMSFTSLTLSGPLISVINPTFGGFSGLNDIDYLILTALMMFGRVEASLVLALFAKSLWRA